LNLLVQPRQVRDETVLEPILESIPASFDRVEFRSFRQKGPDIEVLLTVFVSMHARDRTVSDSFGRALTTDVRPAISVAVPSTVTKHSRRCSKPLLERTEEPDSVP